MFQIRQLRVERLDCEMGPERRNLAAVPLIAVAQVCVLAMLEKDRVVPAVEIEISALVALTLRLSHVRDYRRQRRRERSGIAADGESDSGRLDRAAELTE